MSLVTDIKKLEDENDNEEDDLGEDSENEVEIEAEEEEDEDDEDEEEDDPEEEEDDEEDKTSNTKVKPKISADQEDDEDDDQTDDEENNEDFEVSDEDEEDFKKLENYSVIENLEEEHPEIRSINFEEVVALSRVQRDSAGNIMDPLHMSIPFLTKYEKARIIGARAEQLDRGALPFVDVDENVMNGRTIAIMEFEEKKIPFIIARPMPNKSVEYWRLTDLEFL
jgi:DNA-directed RNA polymerase subunit K/omega